MRAGGEQENVGKNSVERRYQHGQAPGNYVFLVFLNGETMNESMIPLAGLVMLAAMCGFLVAVAFIRERPPHTRVCDRCGSKTDCVWH